MTIVTEIEGEVFKVLRTLTPRGTVIKRDQKLIADLKLLSDDATTMALDLERKYRVTIPRPEWGLVSTVQDVIDLLELHVTIWRT
jgi:acyl carrier protein